MWNRIGHKNQTKTPFELYCGKKPSVKHLKTFGCKAYVVISKQLRNKLNMKAKKGIMIGYAMQTKGYRVWIPEEEKVIETCNVSFNERVNGEAVLGLNNKSEYTPLITEESESDEYESEAEISERDEIPCENLTWIRKAVPRPDGTRVDIYYGFEGRSLRLRSYPVEKYCRAHNIKFNKNFFNFSRKDKYSGPVPKGKSSTSEYNNHEAHVEVVIPRNFKEASLSPDKDKWFVAMKEKINIMSERCVWELVARPEKEKDRGSECSEEESAYEELFTTVMTAADMEGRALSTMFQLLPSRTLYPEYYKVIHEPIDLKMIAQKIVNNEYRSLCEMEKNLIQMIKNAKIFNEPGSQIYKDAATLRKIIVIKKAEIDQRKTYPAKSSERISLELFFMNSVASTLNRVTGMEFNNQISVLTPNNWNTWKHDMQVLLMHYGCWQFIIQTKTEQPDEEATYKEKLDLQLRKDRCYTLIYTNISSDLKNLITETTDGVAAWKILNDHFEPVTRARVIQLLDQFFGTKYQPGEDVGIFISRVKTAATRLQEAGHKLDDLYIGFQLIRWLPQEFQSTVQQIYRWKEEDFRVVKIEAKLILEANRLQLMKQDLEKAENAYLSSFTSKKSKTLPGATAAAHGNPNGKKDYQKKSGKVFNCKTIKNVKQSIKTIGPCYVCNKYGHLKVNCKEKKSLQKSPPTVNETFNTEFDKGIWVIDTAATSHFCNDKSLFFDLKPITNMKMSLATEDKSCPVEGIGTLRFRVKYKGSFHEITLTDVLFNPKLRRNLLSGSRLESKDAHFVGTKDGIKTLLKSSEVPHKFWGEALLCFTYAWNRICHKDSNKTPFEKYSGRKPSVLHLKPFGCLAYAGVPKQIRKKFDMRAKMGIMMGYAQRTKGYRIWLIDENKLVETINGFSDLSEQQEALMVEVTIPNCYKQAIRSRDASKWHDAMDKEINVMKERKVWDLVDHPDNVKILENRWVYTIKYDENNKIVRYKARLVARGNTQLRGESFDEVFQEYQLEFSKVKSLKLRCYSDSDFATNRDDRVSMGGFITFIDGTPISSRTFKQKSVSLSTMEAEYVSLTEAAKEFIWLKNVIDNKSLNLELSENVMFCDNQAAISFSKSPVENYRTKHIDVRYHFLRNLIYDKVFQIKYIGTKNNLADIFTKPMVKEKLLEFCRKLFLLENKTLSL
ncbi:retrovirus-related Pol polyprotein from transposon TNT 1-94 [Trichonephila clavipes]|nr:retrovirus-related Pol polyprotein from transposon TNT 1-94 [Trichonephila clavipes]